MVRESIRNVSLLGKNMRKHKECTGSACILARYLIAITRIYAYLTTDDYHHPDKPYDANYPYDPNVPKNPHHPD